MNQTSLYWKKMRYIYIFGKIILEFAVNELINLTGEIIQIIYFYTS